MALVAGLLIFVSGPRVETGEPTLRSLPANDLEGWLASAEGRYTDITPGIEKQIVWATPGRKTATPLSLVYLHGFSATSAETQPLVPMVAESLGANVYYARLSGHGRGSKALGTARAEDWLADTWEAYAIGRRIGETVVVVGVSTGALLAAWLERQSATDDLQSIVLISPNFGLANASSRILTLPWGLSIARLIVGDTYSFTPSNSAHARYWTTSYPLEATAQLLALMDYVDTVGLSSVSRPVLYMRSNRDRVIDMDTADAVFDSMASTSKQKVVVTNSNDSYGHVIAGEILSPDTTVEVAQAIVRFVRRLHATPPGAASPSD